MSVEDVLKIVKKKKSNLSTTDSLTQAVKNSMLR